jgi:predicted dehydrogenase
VSLNARHSSCACSRAAVVSLRGGNVISRRSLAALARAADVPNAHGDWRALVEDPDVQAVAIATLPAFQARIALTALDLGKPVIPRSPLDSTLDDALAMLRRAELGRLPTMIDFYSH